MVKKRLRPPLARRVTTIKEAGPLRPPLARRVTAIKETGPLRPPLARRVACRSAKDTDIYGGQEEVRQRAQVLPFAPAWLRGRPVERVQRVMSERRQQLVAHLQHVVENVQLDDGLTLHLGRWDESEQGE